MKKLNFKIFLLPLAFFSLGWGWFEENKPIRTETGSVYFFKKKNITCYTTFEYPPYNENPFLNLGKYEWIVCSGSAVKRDVSGFEYVEEFRRKYCYGLKKDGERYVSNDTYHVLCSAAKHYELF